MQKYFLKILNPEKINFDKCSCERSLRCTWLYISLNGAWHFSLSKFYYHITLCLNKEKKKKKGRSISCVHNIARVTLHRFSYFVLIWNMWRTVDLSLKVKSWRKKRSGEKEMGKKEESEKAVRDDGDIISVKSRNLQATIRVVAMSTARIRNESNGFDALRDHE